MPTKKPVIQVVLEEETYNKLKEICEKEKRSTSNKCKIIIEEYIEKYEMTETVRNIIISQDDILQNIKIESILPKQAKPITKVKTKREKKQA